MHPSEVSTLTTGGGRVILGLQADKLWENDMSRAGDCTLLTNTDLRPSRICLGTAEYGSSISRDDAFALMDAFRASGGNFLDTAHIYADWQCSTLGMSERTIGDWLTSRGCRDEMVVATKGGHHALGTTRARLAHEEIRHDLKESLSRLRIERIDLYWLHRDDPATPVGQILDTLEGARQEGLVRWYAASNWSVSRLREAAAYAESHGIPGMVASQIQWSLAATLLGSTGDPTMIEMDEEAYRYHQDTRMPVVAFSSQANGFFSGKYLRDQPDSGRSGVRQIYGSDSNWGRLERACELANELQCTANQVALAYLIAQPFPTFPIVGCRRIDQLTDSCAATQIHLTPEQVDYLMHGRQDGATDVSSYCL